MDSETVARRIAAERTARGWSRAALGEALGWTSHAVRRIETGGAAVTVEDLEPLAEAFGVSLATLLTEPGEDAIESVVTVTRHYCERCQGKRGAMETLLSTDLAAMEGVIGLNRGLAEQARVLAAAMDECPDPTKLAVLSRELRMVMDTLTERVAPSKDSGKKGNGGGGGADFSNLGVPVISA